MHHVKFSRRGSLHHTGVPGTGATDAWYEDTTYMENMTLDDDDDFCGGVADIAKCFDQIIRSLVIKLARTTNENDVGLAHRVFSICSLENHCLQRKLHGH